MGCSGSRQRSCATPDNSFAAGLVRVTKRFTQARKSVKKVRAIMQLIETDRGRLRGAKKRIRAVSSALSKLRDADAMMTTLTKLTQTHRGLIDEKASGRLRRRISAYQQDAMAAATHAGVWQDVVRELRQVQRLAKRWRPRHGGFGALAPGIGATHRLGRKAQARARKSQLAEDFHEWRKQIKALWYELRLLEGSGSTIRRDISALHEAEAWLGEDHNVAVLCGELSKKASPCHGLLDLDRLRLAADRLQCSLRKRATARVQGIYRRGSRSYLRGIERDLEIVSWPIYACGEMNMESNRIDQIAETLDDIATTLAEIKENCGTNQDVLNRMRESIERAVTALDRLDNSETAPSHRDPSKP